jgi:long-subunit fatty acid transport protein
MKRNVVFLLFLFILFSTVFAQRKEKPPLRDRIFFGGYFSARFGNVTNIEVAPIIGYRVLPRFSVGTGIKYEYFKSKYYSYDTHVYGFQVFTRYHIVSSMEELIPGLTMGIFIHAEYEGLSLERQYFDYLNNFPPDGRFWLSSILLGGGISQPIGQRSSFNIMVLWNFNESINSLYDNPVIRIGFNF